MYTYYPSSGKWVKVKRGKPATKKQIAFLKRMGWESLDLTKYGASVIIRSILEMQNE